MGTNCNTSKLYFPDLIVVDEMISVSVDHFRSELHLVVGRQRVLLALLVDRVEVSCKVLVKKLVRPTLSLSESCF